jgi:hypothetical protein
MADREVPGLLAPAGSSPGRECDYAVDNDSVLEAKTIAPSEWRGRPLDSHYLQMLCQMVCTGRRRGLIAVMIRRLDELPLHVFAIEASETAEALLVEAVRACWHDFDQGGLPAPCRRDCPSGADALCRDAGGG